MVVFWLSAVAGIIAFFIVVKIRVSLMLHFFFFFVETLVIFIPITEFCLFCSHLFSRNFFFLFFLSSFLISSAILLYSGTDFGSLVLGSLEWESFYCWSFRFAFLKKCYRIGSGLWDIRKLHHKPWNLILGLFWLLRWLLSALFS